jgi:hypothetical protein
MGAEIKEKLRGEFRDGKYGGIEAPQFLICILLLLQTKEQIAVSSCSIE